MHADGILRGIRRLFAAKADAGATDADLLRRFARTRDEAAFELLVWRHAGLVLHVCRQMLRDEHAVEDAFQATFLVLFRKAGSVLRGEALPGWLHRVAFRASLRARPGKVETGRDLDGVPAPAADETEADTRRVLHEEIARLPAKYRLPIVYCYLEGKTHEEAASELGWPKGTVAGRLARAKDVLHHRLARRGVTLAGLGLASHLSAGAASAGMTHRITALLVALRSVGASALSPTVVILAEGVSNAMFWKSMQWVAVAVVLVGGAGFGGLWFGRSGNAQEEAPTRPPAVVKADEPAAKEAKRDDLADEAARRSLTRRNLRTLSRAIFAYVKEGEHLPAPAMPSNDKPLLSWRVALLPFLGEEKLYDEFKLDEPWDSAHNKKLLAKMPRVYAPVVKTAQPNTTFYQVFVGPGAFYSAYEPFNGGMGYPVPGSSDDLKTLEGRQFAGRRRKDTILVVEAGTAVPWTKPEDIPYDKKKPLPALGGQFENIFHVLFSDGTVRAFPKPDAEMIRYGINPTGDRLIDWDHLNPRGESPVQRKLLDELRQTNLRLGEEAAILSEILGEAKMELANLRWAAEREKMLATDPEAKALAARNAALEKSIKEGRDEARKLMRELRELKEAMKKQGEK